MQSHRNSRRVSVETARQDLMDLAERGLLTRGKPGRRFAWSPAPDLVTRVGSPPT
ncbi:DeoR family transcriptional regulator [Austwickia sp. TVS 96-490-7B]|uniref:DeoR family transcriptional regulator n=1 Tax=Austwickia sp. TVS 96-490-7B TaxID=2830843 RepID=UPI001C56C578